MTEQPFLPFGPAEPEPEPAAGATAKLIEELARVCREIPLEEKILVAPSLFIGHQLVERLAREGHAWINLRVETARTLAHGIVGGDLAREGLRLLSRAQALALVEQACLDALGESSYFGDLRDRPGFHRALQRTFDELRAAGISPSKLPAGAFAEARKLADLRSVLELYDAALRKGSAVDGAEVLRRALEAIGSGRGPGGAARYLVPDGLELGTLERRLIDGLAGGRLDALTTDAPEAWAAGASEIRLFRAIGEENEIREIFRRVLAERVPYDDVEILYTDPSVYPAIVYELAREHEIPCTFASGIAAPFTRPGQSALAFLDWVARGFEAEVLRRALASTALTFERWPAAADVRPRAAARAFREARIGWGAARHGDALGRLEAELAAPEPARDEDRELGPEERAARTRRRLRRLAGARTAAAFAARAVALSACAREERCDPRDLARGARVFVAEFGRIGDALDASALSALTRLFEELEALPPARLDPEEAAARLFEAVRALSVDADRPRPGRIHVAAFSAGGYSGRRHAFLVGLDEARHPGADLEDPVLLDSERRRINRAVAPAALAFHRDRPREAVRAIQSCVARVRGVLTASYSSWKLRSLDQQSEQFPSAFFLELHRAREKAPDADYSDLLRALPEAAGFAPGTAAALDETEWWLSRLRAAGDAAAAGSAAPVVRAFHPHLVDGHRAETARDSEDFTIYDGWVRDAPELDPRISRQPQAASRLELLAECPFRYFLRNVLRIEPPEELERDATEWLDPMAAGSLLHEVFRVFFERISDAGERPERGRHAPLLEEIAEERIRLWRERVPPASESAFGQRRADILIACRTFLALEERHCREVTPRYFEVPFGLTREDARSPIASRDPVSIPLSADASMPLRGSIDRVDQAPDGSFLVWDYKTGGTFRYREGLGIRGGRQIQHALYAMALEVLLARAGVAGRVSASGYFFPGRKGEGQRMAMALDGEKTRAVLRTLLDLLRGGVFPHSSRKEDCRFCDYHEVCGGAALSARRAQAKLAAATLPALRAFQEIHDGG